MMRSRFGGTSGVFAAVVAVSALLAITCGSAGAATGHRRPGATQTCGNNCIKISSSLLGRGMIVTAEVPGDTGTGGKVGQLMALAVASDSPNEDFTDYAVSQGRPPTVAEFCNAWPARQSFRPTSYLCLRLRASWVYELSWSPYGNESGLCMGLARAGVNGENVTLQSCGATDTTLWIADSAHCNPTYCPVINGGDTSFNHPLVLTVDVGSANPVNQLVVQHEELQNGGAVPASQYFDSKVGPA